MQIRPDILTALTLLAIVILPKLLVSLVNKDDPFIIRVGKQGQGKGTLIGPSSCGN